MANTPVAAELGTVVVVAIRDVQDLSLQEIRFRGLLESSPDATLICTRAGRVMLSNTRHANVRTRAAEPVRPAVGVPVPTRLRTHARRAAVVPVTTHSWQENRWRSQYGGMKASEAKRLKELEAENSRPKKLVANQALDIDMLKELAEGNF